MLQFKANHFLTGEELSQQELIALIEEANSLRLCRDLRGRDLPSTEILRGKTVALIFEKPSLRTRVSFTVGVQELGGNIIELTSAQRKSEEPEDTIRVLQGMVHGVMLRTFEHETLERMVSKATIPVINGLSDSHHPCQAIADLLTLRQRFGQFKRLTITYVGDGNNVLHSLLLMAPYVGVNVHYACPEGYQPDGKILERAKARAIQGGALIKAFSRAKDAAKGAHALYTDVWTSMGQEAENAVRMKAFAGYQINADLLNVADPHCIIMHCLPMNKEQEITAEMVEHERSAIFQQAENRLHAQKALMIGLFKMKKTRQTRSVTAVAEIIDAV